MASFEVGTIPVTTTVNAKQMDLILKDVLSASRRMYNVIFSSRTSRNGQSTVTYDYKDNPLKDV